MFCKNLPFSLKKELLNDYKFAWKEITYLINNNKINMSNFKKEDIKLFLSIGIFYKKIILNLHGGIEFFDFLNNQDFKGIQIGSYLLDEKEKKSLFEIVSKFHNIMEWFQIPSSCLEYADIFNFLKNLKEFKKNLIENERK